MKSRDNPFIRHSSIAPSSDATHQIPILSLHRHVRYPNLYAWFVFLASMDVMMTWVVLHSGGSEANVLAHWFLARWGLRGMVGLKFVMVVVVVFICEYIASHNIAVGKNLARAALILNVIPVVLAFVQLLVNKFGTPDVIDETIELVQICLFSQYAA